MTARNQNRPAPRKHSFVQGIRQAIERLRHRVLWRVVGEALDEIDAAKAGCPMSAPGWGPFVCPECDSCPGDGCRLIDRAERDALAKIRGARK